MMLLLDLFWTYLKISFVSFGGMSMVPLLSAEMLSHGWMSASEVGDIVAIAEMTPGPLSLNCASFVGLRVAAIPGSLVANLGVLMPTLVLAFLAALFLEKFKKSKGLCYAMYGIRPAALGMIIAVILTLSRDNYLIGTASGILPYWQTIVIALFGAVMLLKFKLSIPLTILVSAVLGIILVR